MKWFSRFFHAAVLTVAVSASSFAVVNDSATDLVATHKQTQAFKPTREGRTLQLNTFCLDQSGNIMACTSDTENHFVQIYSPEFKLLKEVPLIGRLLSLAVALPVLLVFRRPVVVAVLAGEAVLIGSWFLIR